MFKTMFRPIVTVILLVLLVPTVAIGSEISGRLDDSCCCLVIPWMVSDAVIFGNGIHVRTLRLGRNHSY